MKEIPFFIEELITSLRAEDRLQLRKDDSGTIVELETTDEMPIPDTVRDAVLLRIDDLSAHALTKLELAAVDGITVDLNLVVAILEDDTGIDELFEQHFLVELPSGSIHFRHALTREAIYSSIPWTRRRRLHRQLAEQLEANSAPPARITPHWLAASEHKSARAMFLLAAEQWCTLHAYRDALAAAQQALELWPTQEQEPDRIATLEQFAHCAQLCGQLDDAASAWQEASLGWQTLDEDARRGEAERQLANVYDLQSEWQLALAARQTAADCFSQHKLFADAASERLAAATHLRSAGRFTTARELLTVALADARQAQRYDLEARIIGLEGNVLARSGNAVTGLGRVREGLTFALEHNLVGATAEIYQRLADSLEHAGNYRAAKAAYLTGFEFCQNHTVPTQAQVCIACLTAVLRQTGEWQQASTLCREILNSPATNAAARTVATGILGSIHALRGQTRGARQLLLESSTLARNIILAAMEMLSAWGLALVAELQDDNESVLKHCRFILARWQQIEDKHYAVAPLRWAATRFAAGNADTDTRACADALTNIVTTTSQPETLAALAHALGEVAYLEGNQAQAFAQFTQALELLREADAPYDCAETELRAGVTATALGNHNKALHHLNNAAQLAKQLGARPLAAKVKQLMSQVNPPVKRGKDAQLPLPTTLTRRQRQVLELVASGLTDKAIASKLFLSPRTVEMHVANVLERLDCRSRTEAVHRANELNLLTE